VAVGAVGSEGERRSSTLSPAGDDTLLARLSPEAYLAAARSLVHRERLHRVLDMIFDEDRARSRKSHAPENLATLRKLALNVLRTARPGISIRRKRKRFGWSNDFARSILGQM
jgi:hypothetical protein